MDTNNLSLLWLSFGAFLIACEIFSGTFYLLLTGLSALLIALIHYLVPLSFPIQIILFGALSAVSIFLLRGKRFKIATSQGHSIDEAESVMILNTIAPHAEGIVQYQGVPWTAINETNEDINPSMRAVVVKTQGNKLIIKPLNNSSNSHLSSTPSGSKNSTTKNFSMKNSGSDGSNNSSGS